MHPKRKDILKCAEGSTINYTFTIFILTIMHLVYPPKFCITMVSNSQRSIYLNSNMTPRFWGQNCNFFYDSIVTQFPEETWAQRKPNQYRKMTSRKPQSNVRILIYRSWATSPAYITLVPREVENNGQWLSKTRRGNI